MDSIPIDKPAEKRVATLRRLKARMRARRTLSNG
jgi:hypothetical protein